MSKNENPNLQKEYRCYINLNLRGTILLIGKDLACELPYVNALIDGPLQGSERDEQGNHIIDEQMPTFCALLDYYREWLQLGSPDFFENHLISKRGLIAAAAERMGCEPKFVNAVRCRQVKKYNVENLFRCYYCQQVYARDETASQRECKYHKKDCTCRTIDKYGCSRIPFHSEQFLILLHLQRNIKQTREKMVGGCSTMLLNPRYDSFHIFTLRNSPGYAFLSLIKIFHI